MKKKIEDILNDIIAGVDIESKALVEDGYITSLAIIQLVAELDDAFEIEITYEAINKDNFNSVEAIENMVRSFQNH